MKLTWIGARLPDGRPERHLAYDGIPARDIDDGELTPDQEEQAVASGLYKPADKKPPKTGKEE